MYTTCSFFRFFSFFFPPWSDFWCHRKWWRNWFSCWREQSKHKCKWRTKYTVKSYSVSFWKSKLDKGITLLVRSWVTSDSNVLSRNNIINWLRKWDFSDSCYFIGLFDLMTDKLYSNQKKNYLVFWMMNLFKKPH